MRTSLDSAADGSGGDRARSGARVFTVPAGRPFLQAVAAAILKGDLPAAGGAAPNPLELPDVTLLLPTRRATRAMQEAFLVASGGRAMTLPQIRPISAGDEDLALLAGFASPGTLGSDALDLPPAVSEIERRLVLTMLVQRWSQTIRPRHRRCRTSWRSRGGGRCNTPAQAAHLAAELARLMDMVETENVPLDGLAGLVPDEYSEHWKDTLKFLEIITAFWPAYLEEKKLVVTGGSTQSRDTCRSRAPGADAAVWTGHCCGRLRLGAGDGRADGRRCASAAGRHRAAGSRFASRRESCARRSPSIRSIHSTALPSCSPPRDRAERRAHLPGTALSTNVAGRERADHRGHASVGHDGRWQQYIAAADASALKNALRRRQPDRSPLGAGRSRNHRPHPARGRGDAGPNRRLGLARPAACPPRRRAPRSLGHPRRRQRRHGRLPRRRLARSSTSSSRPPPRISRRPPSWRC